MTSSQWHSQIVPARLSFLAIYNPSLGPTDDTFADQLVFYHSRASQEARTAAKKHGRSGLAGGDVLREEENERLRQIGLAQGMVDFARSFSDGHPVDSIDTEKSRIVLHELEPGWWILASVDLTRIPVGVHAQSTASKKASEKSEAGSTIEYSSREVSPPALLVRQLLDAHSIFALHHGPSLTELLVRLHREKFCGTLERFWSRFSRTWDVLLHGNPAVDFFGGVKLSSGGELGIGVGEEEWGSGERDVLEDLTRRSEGLVDLVVSRFGEPSPSKPEVVTSEGEALPWLGSGARPMASDGVIFGGVGAITKSSLRDLSGWMRQIYTYGEQAYGVRDNPQRERRKRRRRNPHRVEPESEAEANSSQQRDRSSVTQATGTKDKVNIKDWQYDVDDGLHGGVAGQTSRKAASDTTRTREAGADYPGIPPPIVSATEDSLRQATKGADAGAAISKGNADQEDAGTTLGIPDQYMKYLTLGLSTLAKSQTQTRPQGPRRTSTTSSKTIRPRRRSDASLGSRQQEEPGVGQFEEPPATMTYAEPIPDGEALQLRIAVQKRQESRGQFVIGLMGDLDKTPENAEADLTDGSLFDDSDGPRTLLRTVQVQVVPQHVDQEEEDSLQAKLDDPELMPANESSRHFRRLRVLIYVHRPFMYCFLFEQRTPSLAMTGFYRELHSNLVPIYKRLLVSTSQAKTVERVEAMQTSVGACDPSSATDGGKPSSKPTEPAPIYDFIYDPASLTVHTSIPNIPEPGTPAAEGIVTSRTDTGLPSWPAWTRIEALNVHSQLLSTAVGTQRGQHEHEWASKTSRGWWVVWMKLPPAVHPPPPPPPRITTPGGGALTEEPAELPSPSPRPETGSRKTSGLSAPLAHTDSGATGGTTSTMSTKIPYTPSELHRPAAARDLHRIAFLVRKASADVDSAPKPTASSRAVSSMWNSLSLRSSALSDESTGGTSAGWGPAALAGGIGIDARKYVEGLLALNR